MEDMFIAPLLDASLTTFIHGWVIEPPAGLIDRAATGVMPWQTGYETVRAVTAAAFERWLVGRPIGAERVEGNPLSAPPLHPSRHRSPDDDRTYDACLVGYGECLALRDADNRSQMRRS
jgi:hypothetical protein